MSQLPRELIMKISIPATRLNQSGKISYLLAVTFEQAATLFTNVDESIPPDQRHQRKINKTRAASLAGYIVDNWKTGYTIPPLVASISHNNLEYKDGKLTFDSDSIILINDGQHRKQGIADAIEEEGIHSPNLLKEEVGVMLIPDVGLALAQQICSDINSNAKPISPSQSQIYNHRSKDINTTKEIEAKVPLFLNFVDKERGQPAKDKLFTFSKLHKTICLINAKLYDLGVTNEDQYPIISAYWNNLTELINEWDYVSNEKVEAKNNKVATDHLVKKMAEFKAESIAFHGGTLSVLGKLAVDLIEKRGKILIEKEGKNANWHIFFYEQLCPLKDFNFSKENIKLQPMLSQSPKGKMNVINSQNSQSRLLDLLKQEIGLAPKQTELLKP
jgi:DNA sulfur modification protein DndB